MAACFDYIREMRHQNPRMVNNDDQALGNAFDEQLSLMIGHLTESLQRAEGPEAAFNRGKLALQGKRDLMNLLLEKTLEYFKVTDYRGEIAIKELATLYEMLIDSTIDLAEETRR